MPPPRNPAFGSWLRAKRESFGFSRAELAVASGLGVYTVGRIERGQSTPRTDTLKSLLAPLGLKTSDVPDALLPSREIAS